MSLRAASRGTAEEDVRRRDDRYVVGTGQAAPVVWDRASGASVWDVNGREYIDLTSGVIVASLGHAHPRVAAAVAEQAGRLLNCYDAPHPLRGELAQELVELAGPPFEAVSFQSTGSEGIEAALRMARAYTRRYSALSFSNAYHGKTLGALAVSAVPALKRDLAPVLRGTTTAEYPYCYRCPLSLTYPSCGVACADGMQKAADGGDTGPLAAVVVEPLLGVSGAVVPPPEFWPIVRRFADERGAVLIFDEIQSSFGRSGDTWFAFQSTGIVPDIVVAGKSIASGVPMSAVISRRAIFDAVPPGGLRSTYGGNPVSCAAALATLRVMKEEDLPRRAGTLGRQILTLLRSWIGTVRRVGDARGLGMNLGLEIVADTESRAPDAAGARAIYERAVALGVLVLPPTGPHGNVLRIAPPLTIPEPQLWEGFRRLRGACESADA